MTEQVPEELAGLWRERRPELLRQVTALRALVGADAAGELDAAGRERVRRRAHALAGALGSLGLVAAGAAARALELRFQPGGPPAAGPALLALATELEARVGGVPPAPPATPPHDPAAVDVALVEDDELLAELARAALTSHGYSVRWIADGAEAIRLLAGAPPALRAALVLLDWELPSRSGLEVLEALPAGTAVVMVTGHDEPAAAARSRALGARAHVTKPYTVDSLAATVRAQLGR